VTLSALAVTTGSVVFVNVRGALSSDWTGIVEYVGWLVSPVTISYIRGALSSCKRPVVLILLDAKRLYIDQLSDR